MNGGVVSTDEITLGKTNGILSTDEINEPVWGKMEVRWEKN